MNIGVFGGVFNPIHIGHLILAQSALEEFKLDKVIFVPSGNPPHKDTGIIECRHRFKMIELAISDNSKFAVSDIECKTGTTTYTYQTLQEIEKRYPSSTIHFILGSDALKEIRTWKNWEDLLLRYNFLVTERAGSKIDSIEKDMISKARIIDMPHIDISSSQIRGFLREGKTVRYLLPSETYKYMLKNRLYTH